jgi:hypothetical protein
MPVPTVKHSNAGQRDAYKNRVCEMLNGWSKGAQVVRGQTTASDGAGIGMVILEKIDGAKSADPMTDTGLDVLQSLDRLRKIAGSGARSVDPTRGLMLFDKSRLYIVKPIGQRFWTETAALNDADEIAGTILMHSARQ